MTDWTSLNQQAAGYTSLATATDPVTGLVAITFAGLQTTLSAVLAAAGGARVSELVVYCDTITIDVAEVAAEGLTLVARCVDVTQLEGGALSLAVPAGASFAAEVLVGRTTGGELRLAAPTVQERQVPTLPPTGAKGMAAVLLTVDRDGPASIEVLTAPAILQDLIDRPWALNSYMASYTAAAVLMDSDVAADRAMAQAMFDWIVAGVGTLALGGGTVPNDFVELYNQAGALLVSLNVAPGGFFVPILSADMYQGQITALIDALAGYETQLDALAVRTDIAAAVASVSGTLQATAQDEVAPLQAQLDNVQANIAAIYSSIITLRSDFVLQADQADTDYAHLAAEVAMMEIANFLKDSISTVMSVVSLGVAVTKGSEGDVGSVADGMGALRDGVDSGLKALDDLKMTPPDGEELAQQARQVMSMQLALMTSFQSATILWSQARDGSTGAPLPAALAAVAIDPSLGWDNYMAQAGAVLTSLKETIGSDSQDAQDAANAYLTSLQILAGYGKAINGKFVAYADQASQGTVLQAQIAAAKSVAARWQAQQADAKSDEEKLAILSGVLQARANALKRAIYAAWAYYRASYYYVNLIEPPVAITLGMTSAQMQDAFAGVSAWIRRLLGTAPDGQHVTLPNNDVIIRFSFPLRVAGDTSKTVAPGADVALLTPAQAGAPARISWTIPLGDAQLEGVLPDGGDVAIWITGITFTLNGVTPNQKGNVLFSVATSGTYQNGFGPQMGQTFFSKGLVGDFGYAASDGEPYIHWQIPTAVYMTPTPYTQWSLTFYPDGGDPGTATTLDLAMQVAYLRKDA